ncbi:MAG: ATP-dependent RecD-like DNA helicase [Bacillota bacterium]|nr:MAG: ATP-dependent RecD-like DNA helicase [Bacillota bacterium]
MPSASTPPATLEGTLDRITFYNEENGYTVGRLRPTGGPAGHPGASGPDSALVTFVGHFPALRPGENLLLEGAWVDHPDYGRQFKVLSHRVVLPHTAAGIEKYLASGLIRGIGPVTARRLVKHFGVDVLRILEDEPGRLLEVDGIGAHRAQTITAAFAGQKGVKDVMLFLQSVGISPSLAVRIHRHYGDGAVAALRENPYRLADEVFGIGFKTADRIALGMGVPPTSPDRVRAGLRYFLGQITQDGHVFGPRDHVERKVADGLDVDPDLVSAETENLRREGVLHLENLDEGQAVYLAPLYHAERSVAARLRELIGHGLGAGKDETGTGARPWSLPDRGEVTAVATEAGIELSPEQSTALLEALRHGVLVITGGPGTGKTTIINCLLRLCRARRLKWVLAAPTGRAAKRMSEATGYEARTIHRTLEVVWSPVGGLEFQRNEDNPLEADIVIIDEVSMVDLLLMHHLLKAVEPPSCLVLVGDVDQLPAVGPGSVLRDLIASGVLPVVRLTRIFRQATESLIVVNAHRINQGQMPLLNERERDFFFIEETEPESILKTVVSLVSRRLPEHLSSTAQVTDPLSDIQVITPMRRTIIGVEHFNSELQKALNPPAWGKAEIGGRAHVFRTGDKIMQIRNNYGKEVFNGDIGVIRGIEPEDGQVVVSFPGETGPRLVTYERDELDELVLAYATTVHKSQGSEYPVVVMPVSTQHYLMLQRHLLYTAVTRAKRLVVLVGTKKALAIAVRNNKLEERFSRLADRLRAL